MIESLIALIGEYVPLTGTYYLWDEAASEFVSVTQPIDGIAGINFPWVISAAFVLLTVYCLFRFMYGLLFGGGKR